MAQPLVDRRRELYERYQRVPPHQHAEIVRGTLYVVPRPAPRHANASSVLGAELGAPFQRGRGGPGGWWILDEPEIHFAPPLYAEHRVGHVWLVDPLLKTLEAHTLGDDGRWSEVRVYQGDAPVRADPFAAIELDLGALWSAPVRA